ncbi:hypothetical protein PAXRUDRAFT_162105 [Paxillus rubicundulus Ve08.2h10]|uniref:Unplaced genomic scaffold scaffold_1545, whole genome shotgun sequence n=1 Tax=Paxillus rubicundulus Ve08.2h10 TaxID=930991 RepID=A0A0D0D665_9AGAM|nr:hypothetical protein PAXRUDRAFT_162105 [Paxillus rubicundulus Ve08.2h10]
MQSLVNDIIAPYFDKKKEELSLPFVQRSLWKINIWSVHHSEEFCHFCTWMREMHPTIILNYVPGGCTCQFQPCDTGIQCVFKHSLKCSYHADIVQEIVDQFDKGVGHILVEKWLAILCDHSVAWIWDT